MIGRVVATEQFPSTPYQFHFWTSRDTPIGIGAIVCVEGEGGKGRRVYGVVVDGRAYSDLERPLDDVQSTGGDPTLIPIPSDSGEITLWTANVLRQVPEEPIQPAPIAGVRLAEHEDVTFALRMDSYAGSDGRSGVPIGMYSAGGTTAPVSLDPDFLLGPESAHLNISGISGLATKTSAVQFLLRSIFDTLAPGRGRVAAVCFNVKGGDLCFLDKQAELLDSDLAMYDQLGVRAEPFEDVNYYAPLKPDGVNLNTLRSNHELTENVHTLTWGLHEVLDYHEVLLNREDVDAKAGALIDFIADRVLEKDFRDDWGNVHRVTSFADLEKLFQAIFKGLESQGRGDIWRTHHIATIRKVRNRLLNVSTRCRGLVSDDGASSDLPFGAFQDRSIYVVDVAGTDQLAQDLVFTRIVSKLREHMERRDLGVEHVVVFVDELNKYAPVDGQDTYVRRMLMDLSERGRYLGLVLFGAQQFRSQVHRRVTGNSGTNLYGRMDMEELSQPGYQVFSPATKGKLAALPKGEIMVRHPHFTQPVFLKFPRPPVMQGSAGVQRFPPAAERSFNEAVVLRMQSLDRSLQEARLRELIEGRDEEEVRAAIAAAVQAGSRNAFKAFQRALGGRVERQVGVREGVGTAPIKPLEDPYS